MATLVPKDGQSSPRYAHCVAQQTYARIQLPSLNKSKSSALSQRCNAITQHKDMHMQKKQPTHLLSGWISGWSITILMIVLWLFVQKVFFFFVIPAACILAVMIFFQDNGI